ncbi:hypothetical protein C8Q77DRAFT_1075045 [Trametes polyzona]|nr:hypothetical protein C8Q77DRAFT_1075045 [Trametes polyzona]
MPAGRVAVRQMSHLKDIARKLKPKYVLTGVRALRKGVSKVPLSPVIMAVKTTGEVGASIPSLAGICSVLAKVLERAEETKKNREECRNLARRAEELVSFLVTVVGDGKEEELDEKTRLNLADFEWRMEEIVRAMARVERIPAWRRFLGKDKHKDTLAQHKENLERAFSYFAVSCIV